MWYSEWFGSWFSEWYGAIEDVIVIPEDEVEEVTTDEMKRREVRLFLLDVINGASNAKFNSGRITEFNSARDNEYPFVWLESLSTDTTLSDNKLPIDDWNIVLHIAKKDAPDSQPQQYEEIVDQCDEIAQLLVYEVNNVTSGYELIQLSGLSREPFIKKHADCTSGIILSFTMNIPDTTNVC